MNAENIDYTYTRRLGVGKQPTQDQFEEESYDSDEEEVLRMQDTLKGLVMPDLLCENTGASMSLITTAIKSKTIKFIKRPFGFSIETHPVLDCVIVTNITNPELKEIELMAVAKIGDKITNGINLQELLKFLKTSQLPVEITFRELTIPDRKSTHILYSPVKPVEHSEEKECKWVFPQDNNTDDVKSSSKRSPLCLRPSLIKIVTPHINQHNLTPGLTKLIHERPEVASLIERVSRKNLTRASTEYPDGQNSKKISKKPATRVSYLHDVLRCHSNEYEFTFHEDEKSASDSEGSNYNTSEEEELFSMHNLFNGGPVHLTRSTTYDCLQSKRFFEIRDVFDIISHHNPATYRDLSMKGIEGNAEKWSTMCKERVDIIQELYDTEQIFLIGIEKLYHEFLKPISEILKQKDKLTLLNYIPQIVDLSHTLLEEFKKSDNIAKTFLTWGQGLKIYSKYIVNYSDMCVLVRDLEKQKKFKRYCKRNKISSKIFYSNCILPVQRGPRYNLLLKELRKKTQSDHGMVKDLDEAIAFTSDVCHIINEHGTILENQHHLFRISSTIKEKSLKENGIWPLVKPSRTLVREGTVLCYASALKKKDHKKDNIGNVRLIKTVCVLCNDILLIIFKQKVKRLMKLNYMRECDIEINHNGKKFFGLHITDTNDEFLIFYVHQQLDRDAWSESIRKYIGIAQEIQNKSLNLLFQSHNHL